MQKILLLVAVITVTAHSTFPHVHLDKIMAFVEDQHHDEHAAGKYHHDHADNSKGDQHNLFSFVQLDDDFIPATGQAKNFEIPSEFLTALIDTYLSNNFPANIKTDFGWYKEYPPPDYSCYISSLRGPPIAL